MKLENKGLVLEGGGMRGAYTAGVLDYLMRNNVKFPYVIGVSAGANNGANYVADQRERNKKVFVDMVTDERYLGLKNLIKDGNYFGMDFLFKELPNELVPFDYNTFGNSPITFKVVVTKCRNAQTEYFDKDNFDPKFFGENILRASSSIPVLTKPVKINGEYYFDGGITDPIPLEKAIKDGYENNVVILTKHKGFRLKYKRSRIILKLLLRDYPQLTETLKNRYKIYNQCIEWIERLEEKGKIFIFRPKEKLGIGGLESNPENLKKIYKRGYEETKNRFKKFEKWNEENS